ncbi:DUF3370 domain-containing protein [Trichothermofontia sp.]
MLPLLFTLTLAQTTLPVTAQEAVPISRTLAPPVVAPQLGPPDAHPQPEITIPTQPAQPVAIVRPIEIRPLPGDLDEVPVFNSNSPEIVKSEGILLSTFPPTGMANPAAHLNFPFEGRFDIFSHHIARARTPSETRTLFQGLLLHNASDKPVEVRILEAASYLTRPDALFVELPPYLDNRLGNVFAGPGSRVSSDILRGRRRGAWPTAIQLEPQGSHVLINLPIPTGKVVPSSNGRTTLIRLQSDGPVYVANLAMFAPLNADGTERFPVLDEWKTLLVSSPLVQPRDIPPSSPDTNPTRLFYGRVAGVSQGSRWVARLTDAPNADQLSIPQPGRAFSYGLSLLPRGTWGTGQVQSAPMLARYPDTAYQAHGNYGVQYSLTLPLVNTTSQDQMVEVALETPIKEDDPPKTGLRFFEPPESRIFFRGTVRIRYQDENNRRLTQYVHVVQRRGEEGAPLLSLNLGKGEKRLVEVDCVYPPDATPPQVLTVRTLDSSRDLLGSRDLPIQ